ncbi:MAG TPA: NUDIX domain-containing protein [Candidatus Saccharimonadales bacterium]|nr:NUDIX domain-containing protein [Candidatus Saccharimonadales bacterium]
MSKRLTNIVVCAIIERDGKIFLAKRADTKATLPGNYEILGGHLDPGEDLEVALKREVREEIGVEVEVVCITHAFTYESEGVFKVEICYLCRLLPGNEPMLNPEDHSESKWIDETEVGLIADNDPEAVAVHKAFNILKGVN